MKRNARRHSLSPLCGSARLKSVRHARLRRTPRMREVARLFGIGVPRRGGIRCGPPPRVAPNTVTLITGTSGAGKSTLLRQIEASLRSQHVRVINLWQMPLPRDRAMVDCFSLPLRETLSVLARAGLAEAPLFLLPPAVLSEGQQFRYRLAQWFGKTLNAERGTQKLFVLVADEFCSMLDRATAKAVAWQLGAFVRATPGCAAVVATAHEDLMEDLQPDCVVRKELGN
jgi:ABC-type ATPase involved in cell division